MKVKPGEQRNFVIFEDAPISMAISTGSFHRELSIDIVIDWRFSKIIILISFPD